MLDLAGLAPPVLHATFARSAYATRLFNVTITNVPGPQVPLSSLGCHMREILPLVPLAAHHAVGIAIFSYDGGLVFGLSADRDSTPDLEVLRGAIERELSELSSVTPPPAPARTSRPGRTRERSQARAAASPPSG
jgi:hypothetical protein